MRLLGYLIILFGFIASILAKDELVINKTNVNPVTNLFDRELDNKEAIFEMVRGETEFFKNVIAEGQDAAQLKLTDESSLFQELTEPNDEQKLSKLKALNIEDMKEEGYKAWQDSDDYEAYRDLAIDEDDYGFYRQTASELFSYTDRKLNSIMEKLSELGISDCQEQLVTENIKGKYELNSELIKSVEEDYSPKICESLRNKYLCHRHLVLNCVSSVQRSLADIADSNLPLMRQQPNSRETIFGINYLFGGPGQQYDYEISFNLPDKQSLEIFSLDYLDWDDHIRITLNDVQVFMGPVVGDRLELLPQRPGKYYKEVVIDNSNDTCSAEFSTWYSKNVNIDLKPYLRSGKNIIKIRLIVAGKGGIILRFQTSLKLCQEWNENWEEICVLE